MPKVDKETCIGCGACTATCPHDAIKMVDNKAEIDQKKCKKCNDCIEICPVQAIK